MPIQTDILQTVFAVKGLNILVSAFEADAAAQQKVLTMEARVAAQAARGNVSKSLARRLHLAHADAAEAAARAEQALAGVMAGASLAALKSIVQATEDAISSYVAFGRQVQDLRDLTGASAQESARAAELFRVAGVKDSAAIRDALKLAKDLQSAQGQSGLAQLGISPQAGENAIHLFDRVLDRLREMPAGMERTAIAEELFGARGAAALAPLLRMTKEEADQARALGDAFNQEALVAIQAFEVSTNQLGQSIQANLVYPFAQALLPALTQVAIGLTWVIDLVGKMTHGTTGIFLMAGAFIAVGSAIGVLIAAIPALVTALKSVALVEAIIDALAGQWGNLAAGLAVGAIAGIGLYGLGNFGSAQEDNTSALHANTESNLRAASAMNKFTDAFLQANRGGIPKGLQRGDVAELARQNLLGFVG